MFVFVQTSDRRQFTGPRDDLEPKCRRGLAVATGASVLTIVKRSFSDFFADEAPVRAAALAYYTVFALPPLLVLLIMAAGLVWDASDVRRAMETQFTAIVGVDGARTVQAMIDSADRPGGGKAGRTLLGVAGLIFGATGAFLQLQGALNRAWEVKPDPAHGGVGHFVMKRVLSLGMVLGVGFLVAGSLALSAVLSMIGDRLGAGFPDGLLHAAHFTLSFAVLALLFAAIYKVLPDAAIAWRDVAVGAIVTAALFVAGKVALGFYLGRSSPGEAFGAAGALAGILVWVYYAGMIVLYGAEFTQAWAKSRGRDIRPERGAIRIENEARARAAARESRSGRMGKSLAPSRGSRSMHGTSHRANGAPSTHRASSVPITTAAENDIPVGELFRHLSADTSHLFRQEISLAKAELKESASHAVKGATKIGIAAGVAIPGLLAFGAFLIIALGDLMNGNYWLSALMVSLAMLGAAALLARQGIAAFGKASLVPEETAGTLREDVEWAKGESQAFKRAITAPYPRTH